MKTIQSLILFFSLCSIGLSFTVNPMVADFDPNAPQSQQVFVLENKTDKDTPVEILVAKPVTDENGVESLEMGNGEDLFLILPQQLVLPPNSRRSVKVMYVGDPREEEDTYRILFNEIPVEITSDETELPEGESSFTMSVVMQYHTRVWVTPGNLKEDLKIKDFKKVSMESPKTKYADGSESETGEPMEMLELTVSNEGEKHGYVRYPTITIMKVGGKPVVMSKEDVKSISGQVIFRNSEKTFRIPWKEEFPEIASIKDIRLETIKR